MSGFPRIRPRRLRQTSGLRRLTKKTRLLPEQMVYPLFVVPGRKVRKPIPALPDCFHLSPDMAAREAAEAFDVGIGAVLLFGVPDRKDEKASEAVRPRGLVPQAVRAIKREAPDLVVMTDVCVCAYMSHGHCGVVERRRGRLEVDNDRSLPLLAAQALTHAGAGADVVAPSAMMDGQVAAIRDALDTKGLSETAIMSYASKFASAFYGPFRQAAKSAPAHGDRASYQLPPGDTRQAVREAKLDETEGADILMVKPALPYLDIIALVRSTCNCPVAAYQVSGEYAALKAAAEKGWVDEVGVFEEALLGIARAGADLIISYWAKSFAMRRNHRAGET